MAITELQQSILDIINYAKSAKNSEFRFITTWAEYKFYRGTRKTYKVLLKVLQKSTKSLCKKYYTEVSEGNANFNRLLAYEQLAHAVTFYEQELFNINEMICEYEAYLFEGNLLFTFLGEPRADDDLVDFRRR